MLAAAVILGLAAGGCRPARPVPKPVPVIHPSILVDPPYPGVKQPGAAPVFPKMHMTGNSGSNNDRVAGTFHGNHDYTLQRGDKQNVNPADIDDALRLWIEKAPGVTVTKNSTEGAAAGTLRRTIDYTTSDTVGYATYEIQSATPAPKVRYVLTVQEHRR